MAAKPRSNGSDIGGIMFRVYSTPMKNKSDAAKTQGTGCWRGKPHISAAVHFKKWALPTPPQQEFLAEDDFFFIMSGESGRRVTFVGVGFWLGGLRRCVVVPFIGGGGGGTV